MLRMNEQTAKIKSNCSVIFIFSFLLTNNKFRVIKLRTPHSRLFLRPLFNEMPFKSTSCVFLCLNGIIFPCVYIVSTPHNKRYFHTWELKYPTYGCYIFLSSIFLNTTPLTTVCSVTSITENCVFNGLKYILPQSSINCLNVAS